MENVYKVADAHDANFKLQILLGLDELPEILRGGEYTTGQLLKALESAQHPITVINRLIEAGAVDGPKISKGEAIKDIWKDPEYRARMEELWKDPEYRARRSEAIKELWKDPEYRDKVIAGVSKVNNGRNVPRRLRSVPRSSLLLFYRDLPQDTRGSHTLDTLYSAWLTKAGIELWKEKLGEQLESYEREGKGRLGLIQDMVSYRDTEQWKGYFERFSKTVMALARKSYLKIEGTPAKT